MFSKKGYNADAKLLISLGLRHYPSSFSSSFLSISVIDAIVSISIPLAYIVFATIAIPSALPASIPSSLPSALPSALPSSFAVSNEFLMSRYALRLSSLIYSDCLITNCIIALGKDSANRMQPIFYKDTAINQNIQDFTQKKIRHHSRRATP